MVNVVGFTEEDEEILISIYEYIEKLYGEARGEYYKINIDGEDAYLHVLDGAYTVFDYVDEEHLEYMQFMSEEDAIQVDYDDCSITWKPGEVVSYSKVIPMAESVRMIKRENDLDFDGYNGVIGYIQYDTSRDKRVIITYQHMYRDDMRINTGYIQAPLHISYETRAAATDNGSKIPRMKKSFTAVRVNYNQNATLFNKVTQKEFGIKAFKDKGALALQKKDEIIRYCKDLFIFSDRTAFTGFPYCQVYTQGDMNTFLEKNGFRYSIPEYMIELFNGENTEIRIFRKIVVALRTYEEEISKKTLDYR